MKVLIITNLYPPHVLGGYEILCGQVAEELTQRGHEVVVLTSTHGLPSGEPHPSEEAACSWPRRPRVLRELELYLPFEQPARLLRSTRRRIGRRNGDVTAGVLAVEAPDVVFVWSQLRLTMGAATAAEASGIPVAYTFNDEHAAGFLPVPWRVSFRRIAGCIADRVVMQDITLSALELRHVTCISRTLKESLLARGVRLPRAQVIHQGIPIRRFPYKTPRARIDRARILYTGQLHADKGVHELLAALTILARDLGRDAFELTVAGEGRPKFRAELEQFASDHALKVRFRGRAPHEELPLLYRQADVFVFPSVWREPFGLTHLEAMASGVPVISTVNGGQREFLEHDVNCLVYEAGRPHELSTAIARLLHEPQTRWKLSSAARRLVEERFTLSRYVNDLESFLARGISACVTAPPMTA